MKKGRVVNLKFLSSATFFTTKNKILILSSVLLIIGLIFGVASLKKNDLIFNFVSAYSENFISARNTASFLNIFINSFLESFGFIFLIFYFGTSIFGVVFLPFFIAFRGYLYGATAAFLYSEYLLKGVALNAIIVLPGALFFMIAFLLSSCEAFKFSFALANQTFYSGEYKNLSLYFKNYCYKYLLYIILLILSAVTDTLISLNFLKQFL